MKEFRSIMKSRALRRARRGSMFLSILLLVGAAIFFWMRPLPFEETRPVDRAFPPVRSRGISLRQPSPLHGSEASPSAGLFPRDPMADTLASIRLKLRQLGETKMADKEAQDELMTGLLALLTDDNAAEITQSLSAADLNSPFGLAALQRWLKVDVSLAADWVAARTDATDEQAWAVAHQLIEDQRSVEVYCDRLPDTAWKQTFFKNAGMELVWKDSVEAIQVARRMNPGERQTSLLRMAVYAWMVSDPRAASGWIIQVADPLLQEKLVCSGAEAHATNDPRQAMEWLIAGVPAPSAGSEILVGNTLQAIVGIWVETKPAQIAELVSHFSAGDMRDTSVEVVARRWLQLDPAAATLWIKTLPEGEKFLASNRPN